MTKSFAPPVSNFLSEEDRHSWLDKGQTFLIIGVKYEATGKFGAAYTYKLATTDSNGEVDTHFLSLSANARRAEEAEWMQEALTEDASGIGPVKLGQFPTTQGNPAWGFVEAE